MLIWAIKSTEALGGFENKNNIYGARGNRIHRFFLKKINAEPLSLLAFSYHFIFFISGIIYYNYYLLVIPYNINNYCLMIGQYFPSAVETFLVDARD